MSILEFSDDRKFVEIQALLLKFKIKSEKLMEYFIPYEIGI